jgi:hypothetical protein
MALRCSGPAGELRHPALRLLRFEPMIAVRSVIRFRGADHSMKKAP